MTTQLVLLDTSPSWKLDDKTREIGRRGIAEARAALRRASTGPGRGPSRTKAA